VVFDGLAGPVNSRPSSDQHVGAGARWSLIAASARMAAFSTSAPRSGVRKGLDLFDRPIVDGLGAYSIQMPLFWPTAEA
jgi:hypothetical protein